MAETYIKLKDDERAISELKKIMDLSLDEEEVKECKKRINMLRAVKDKENFKTANLSA